MPGKPCINLTLRPPRETVAFWEGCREGLRFARGRVSQERDRVTFTIMERTKTDFGLKHIESFLDNIEKIYLPHAREAVEKEKGEESAG